MERKDAAATQTKTTKERRCAKTKLRPSPCANFVAQPAPPSAQQPPSAESAVSPSARAQFASISRRAVGSYRCGTAAVMLTPRNSAARPKGLLSLPPSFFLSGLSQEKNHVMCRCGASAHARAFLKGQSTKTERRRGCCCCCCCCCAYVRALRRPAAHVSDVHTEASVCVQCGHPHARGCPCGSLVHTGRSNFLFF